MNPTIKRYLISSVTTFVAAFCIAIAAQLKAGVPMEFTTSVLFAVISVAGRAGVKAVVEAFAGQTADVQA